MRSLPVAALLIVALLGGCAHRPAAPTATTPAVAPAALLQQRLADARPLHIYASSGQVPGRDADELARTLALTVRDTLRSRGFNIRGAEAVAPTTPAATAIGGLARNAASGVALPAAARPLSYLHANAPRLLFCIHLEGTTADESGGAGMPPLALGGFLADSRDGAILWSARLSLRGDASDIRLRELVGQLLAPMPLPSPR